MALQLLFQLFHLAAVHSLGLIVGNADEDVRTSVHCSLKFIHNTKALILIPPIRKTVCRQASSGCATKMSDVFINGLF